MRYNGIDLTDVFSVTKYEGLVPSLMTTMWSPTYGNGDRVATARQPNKTIKVYCTIETDDAGLMADKKEALYTIFRSSKDYVPIVFEEVDNLEYQGVVTAVQETGYYFTVADYVITLTCLPFRYGQTVTASGSGNSITGNNSGTAPSVGQLFFTVSNDPDSLTILLGGTSGSIQLSKPSDDTLDGSWVIDLEKRTVYRDNSLAMTFVNFENTDFELFEVPAGNFEINFSSAVTDSSYVYTEVFL